DNSDIKVYFRVGGVMNNVTLQVRCGDSVVSSQKKRKMAPGEMEYVVIKKAVLDSNPDSISVEILA
ncbi:MAG: pyridine nucleotide-disulfide oxidoreductase, partial [Clostridia bacterium]|nr:pyridine nucleotide-disulfide oxidoreductase [Clostridia bacterium]